MTSIATVKPKLDSARVAAGASTKLSFAVTNTTGRALRMGAKMLADAPADAAWAKLTGNNEREFGVDDFDQFDVDVTIPADAAPGQYKFRLLVFQTDEPGELFTEGPTVSIQVPKPDEPVNDKPDGGGFPWWIAVVVGVLALLVVGGVVAWYLLKPSDVPDVTGMQLDDAIIALQEADLDIPQTGGVIEEWTGEAEPGFVTKQMPEAGGDKPDDGLVTLTIEQLTVAVPSVIGMKVPAATTLLSEAGLGLSGTIDFQRSDRFPGGAIIAQQPTATERAIPGQEVAVTVAEELIPVPDLNGKSFSQASVALEALGLAVGKISHEKTGGSPDTVVRQEPSANTEAKAASAVDLWLVEKKIAVPNVKGKEIKAAQAAVKSAGLKPVLLPIAPPAGSQQTRLFNNPTIAHSGTPAKMRLDWCLTWGKDCGRPAADLFCQKQGYQAAAQVQIAKDIGLTKLLKTGQVCKEPSCDGFASIVCRKETSEPVNQVREQRPSANSKVYTGAEVTLVYYRAQPVHVIAQPMMMQPKVLKSLQKGTIQLREVEGQLRSVAPE